MVNGHASLGVLGRMSPQGLAMAIHRADIRTANDLQVAGQLGGVDSEAVKKCYSWYGISMKMAKRQICAGLYRVSQPN